MGVSADWRVKRVGGGGSFKAVNSVVDLSASAMLLAQTPVADDEQAPNKLDNFLGCNPLSSSSDHDHLHLNHNFNMGGSGSGSSSSSSMLGLSMIKSWLRTHPPNSNISSSLAGTEIGAPAQALSLSTASASGGGCGIDHNDPQMQTAPPVPPLLLDNSSNDDTPTTLSADSLPRRSADTFGQRTSIYRGVTRFALLPFSLTPHHLLLFIYAYICSLWRSIYCTCMSQYICWDLLAFGAGIDGLGDMRLTFGTIPAVGKAKLAREGKVTVTLVPSSDATSHY